MPRFRELTDRYALEKILKSTRAATVLKARDGRTGQAVAVKLVTLASPAALAQQTPEMGRRGGARPQAPRRTDRPGRGGQAGPPGLAGRAGPEDAGDGEARHRSGGAAGAEPAGGHRLRVLHGRR